MNLRKRNKGTVEVHTSALNDIMFFLLLFFLLASAVVNPQVVKLLLPRSESGQQSSAQKTVTVSIDEKLNYFVDKQKVSLDQMQPMIETLQKASPDLTIVLYVARGVSIENTMQVFDVANKLKLKVVLAVEPKK
ncbi:biopolymer transporter ExbD [Pedobacter hiemivivus]|uniref:Biopolymer transporter ExbD n=1 Tax=Pedobacter hiemivivus TaxID=2530454 RepID=A0A4R0N948_9SPHI|nr:MULTISPECIES: biopolymer transporter ExbD [Pedobacter]TCC96691.1 biopolymer transporter ExbD [Pedobacter hiemivivus]TKC55310.1 biopolymer transporter ExbD [Pedobacter hiemivivus]SDL51809.1 biopolymer transport protein ExbD [Pedobacter sp. ok626]